LAIALLAPLAAIVTVRASGKIAPLDNSHQTLASQHAAFVAQGATVVRRTLVRSLLRVTLESILLRAIPHARIVLAATTSH